jgi:large subunit ribosomal protein L24
MRIKAGDNVIVIAGADRGKTAKVSRVFPSAGKVLVEGVNVKKRHERPRRSNEKGGIVEKALPIHHSNVMLRDPSDGKRVRLGVRRVGGKRERFARRSGMKA